MHVVPFDTVCGSILAAGENGASLPSDEKLGTA